MNIVLSESDIPPAALEKALADAVKASHEDLQLYDAKQAAAFLKVPVTTFRDLAKRSGGGCFDLGERRARWSVRQLRALLATREVKAAAQAAH